MARTARPERDRENDEKVSVRHVIRDDHGSGEMLLGAQSLDVIAMEADAQSRGRMGRVQQRDSEVIKELIIELPRSRDG